MARNRIVRVDDLVDGLKRLEDGFITRDRVSEYLGDLRIDATQLERYTGFRPDRYARHLIFRDALFEVMVICWEPGQRTPVHSHNGQLGWMLIERGGVEVTNFKYLSCNAPDNQNVAGIDCLAGATAIQLERRDHQELGEGSPVSTVDKVQTIHQIGCPTGQKERAISLHIYSTPFASCVSFDLEASRCQRRTLFWDSEYGVPVGAEPGAGAGAGSESGSATGAPIALR